MSILFPVLLVSAVGAVAGAGLSIASAVMKTEGNETVSAVNEVLPGANCGGCGFSGCEGYAEAIVNGEKINLCAPGGAETVAKIAAVMGVDAVGIAVSKAVVRCGGDEHNTLHKADYSGIGTCAAAALYLLGPAKCSYGCMGLGDCAAVCAFDAIEMRDGVAVVDMCKCTGCGTCVSACPKGLIAMHPVETGAPVVLCMSNDAPADTRHICQAGCISCRLCVRACEFGAITVEDGLALIDPEKCTACDKCVTVCPTGSIVK